jgi:hypothetical protein
MPRNEGLRSLIQTFEMLLPVAYDDKPPKSYRGIAWESTDSAIPIFMFCLFCGDAVTIERRPPS